MDKPKSFLHKLAPAVLSCYLVSLMLSEKLEGVVASNRDPVRK